MQPELISFTTCEADLAELRKLTTGRADGGTYWLGWLEDFTSADAAVRKQFCRTAVDRLCRVFDPNAVRASLPEALQEWVDSSTGVNTDDLFGANDMVPAGVDPVRDATLAVVAQLLEKVSSHAPVEDIDAILDEPNDVLDAQENVIIN
jgi:hypothetical protein